MLDHIVIKRPRYPRPPKITNLSELLSLKEVLTTIIFPIWFACAISRMDSRTALKLLIWEEICFTDPAHNARDKLWIRVEISSEFRKSVAIRSNLQLGFSDKAVSGAQISRFPISIKLPYLFKTANDAATIPGDVKELIIEWIPIPNAFSATVPTKSVDRVQVIWENPRVRIRKRFLTELADPITAYPFFTNNWAVANPTPPDIPCNNTESSLCGLLCWDKAIFSMIRSAVIIAVGRAAADACEILGGLNAQFVCETSVIVPKHPAESPNTASPLINFDSPVIITPEKSLPGLPGSPGYMPKIFKISRKFRPTAFTAILKFEGITQEPNISWFLRGIGVKSVIEPRGFGFIWNSAGFVLCIECISFEDLTKPSAKTAPKGSLLISATDFWNWSLLSSGDCNEDLSICMGFFIESSAATTRIAPWSDATFWLISIGQVDGFVSYVWFKKFNSLKFNSCCPIFIVPATSRFELTSWILYKFKLFIALRVPFHFILSSCAYQQNP